MGVFNFIPHPFKIHIFKNQIKKDYSDSQKEIVFTGRPDFFKHGKPI
jgi:hypothetical protein